MRGARYDRYGYGYILSDWEAPLRSGSAVQSPHKGGHTSAPD